MVEVEKDKVYNTADKRCGVGKGGEYFVFPVKAQKGYDKISVWAAEGTITKELKSADAAKVKEIVKTKKSGRNLDGKWYDNYDVVCVLEPVSVNNSNAKFDEFMAGPSNKEIDDLFALGNDEPPFNF